MRKKPVSVNADLNDVMAKRLKFLRFHLAKYLGDIWVSFVSENLDIEINFTFFLLELLSPPLDYSQFFFLEYDTYGEIYFY